MKRFNPGLVLLLALGIFGALYLFDHTSFDQSAQSAAVLTARQVETALEFYYIEHGYYPRVSSDKLISELKRTGDLQQSFPDVAVNYRALDEGARYELSQR